MELDVFQAPGLEHGFLEALLDNDDRGPHRFLFVTRVSGDVAKERPEGFWPTGVVFELEINVPEPTLMTDRCQMMSGRRRRRRGVFG